MDKLIHSERHMRIICIGAGAAGLCFAYKLQRSFTNFSLTVYEKNQGIAGVWFENRYPGCACDFPSHNYTYSFEPKVDWPRVYATGLEIRQYFEDFATKYGLHEYCKTGHEVVGARWDSEHGTWQVQTKNLANHVETTEECHILINATGVLNAWRWPDLPGLHDFEGPLIHSARWDESVKLAGKRVGLIGNGSSGQQILAAIQPLVGSLTTFVRQPNWVLGPFGEQPREYSEVEIEDFKTKPGLLLEKRKRFENVTNTYFTICEKEGQAQAQIRAFLAGEMEKKINSSELRELLIPTYGVGCRRPTSGIHYLESLNASNTKVVYGDLTGVTKKGVIGKDSTEYPFDVLICATGFDTSYTPRFAIIGERNVNLQHQWAHHAKCYLATSVAGFPNYFMFCGPNNPFASGAYLSTVEAQADYMLKFCDRWQTENILSFAPKEEAVEDFLKHTARIVGRTVWADDCRSWYKNHTKAASNLLLWPGSGLHFIEAMSNIRADDYNITYRGNRFDWLGNGFSQTELDPLADKAFYIRERDDSPLLSRAHRRKVLTGNTESSGKKPGMMAFGVS